ncbi:MAG: hypothetical protein AAF799_47310 [Myxococcota bacterium]
MRPFVITAVPSTMLLVCLSACPGQNATVRLAPGTYELVSVTNDATDPSDMAPELDDAVLEVAESLESATVTLADGTVIEMALTLAPREQWSSGCFTMASQDEHETYRVEPSSLSVGTVELAAAVLVADDCAETAEHLVLSQLLDAGHSIGCDGKRCLEFERLEAGGTGAP